MQEIKLSTPGPSHRYTVYVGTGVIAAAGTLLDAANYSQVMIVTDRHMVGDWLPQLQAALPHAQTCVVAPGERAKSLATVEQIWKSFLAAGLDRHSLVVILGGGVVGDLAAFAASTYERGVAFAQIPSTIVAQDDSSIGGKTGFDFGGLKNLIGTFAQPLAVLVDTDLLATLPARELTAGFAEMLKHGLIRDAQYFEQLSAKAPGDYSAPELSKLITTSIRIKATIVEEDVNENGQRKLVNFGHTVGHAVEALSWDSGHPLLHGEAVAIGMVVEAQLSAEKGLLPPSDADRIKQAMAAAGLPVTIPGFPPATVLAKMHRDKKANRGTIAYTLLRQIGQAVVDQNVSDEVVMRVLERNMEPPVAK